MAGALLLAAAWRRVVPVVVAAANGALMVVGCGGAWALTQALGDARWDHVERLEGGRTELVELVTTLDGWGELAWTAVGQGWYLAVGSLGLSVVGLVAVGRRVADRQVPPDGPGGRDRVASRWALGFLLVAAAGVFATSVAFFAQNQFRADHLVYGRHNDSFTPMWVAAASSPCTACPGRPRRGPLRWRPGPRPSSPPCWGSSATPGRTGAGTRPSRSPR